MATITTAANGKRTIGRAAARLGFWLGVVAIIVLAAGPLGWRTGLMHYRIGLLYLMPAAALAAAGAAIVSLFALAWWRPIGARARALAVLGLALGIVAGIAPFRANLERGTMPPIHDITTDTANPPPFAVTLAARASEKGNPVEYSQDVAKQQRTAYPDIAPMRTNLPPAEAYKRAFATAQSMPGWTIVAADAGSGRIEASQKSLFYGFTDDIVVRVAADEGGSRIDMRSESRQGRSDFGVNAKRVRGYLEELRRRLG